MKQFTFTIVTGSGREVKVTRSDIASSEVNEAIVALIESKDIKEVQVKEGS